MLGLGLLKYHIGNGTVQHLDRDVPKCDNVADIATLVAQIAAKFFMSPPGMQHVREKCGICQLHCRMAATRGQGEVNRYNARYLETDLS